MRVKSSVRAALPGAIVLCLFFSLMLLSGRGGPDFLPFKRRYRIEVTTTDGRGVEAAVSVLTGEEWRVLPAGAEDSIPRVIELRVRERELAVRAAAPGYHPAELVIRAAPLFRTSSGVLALEPVRHHTRIETEGGTSLILVDGAALPAGFDGGCASVELDLSEGRHAVTLVRKGIPDQTSVLDITGPSARSLRHQTAESGWKPLGSVPAGRQPKGISFTPDGRRLIVTLLDDSGFDLIDLDPGSYGTVRRVEAPRAPSRGYVESLVCEETGSFWVSQMTTGMVYEYRLPDGAEPAPRLLRAVQSRGIWPKVMAADPDLRWLAVSNWVSSTVAVLDYATGEPAALLDALAVPRGLAFSPDGTALYVCSFEGGAVVRYDTAEWRETGRAEVEWSAMRHIVLSPDGKTAWVSDMARGRVYRLDTERMRVDAEYRVGSNPNTIALSPDGSRLFVSCRGMNAPEGYLNRSPVSGEIHIFDAASGERETILYGGNQPTGLAVSPDGLLLAFSNFLDREVEIYAWQPQP